MSEIVKTTDAVMCFFWITTYTLVFIGTKKYKYPSISPITQAVVAPFEFAVTIVHLKGMVLNYALIAYFYWSFIEIAIITLIVRQGKFIKQRLKTYILFIVLLTCIMVPIVKLENGMLYSSYINTIIGAIFWYFFILNPNYPVKPINLLAFLAKFIADILGMMVYYGSCDIIVDTMSVFLPVLDFFFILTYLFRRFYKEKYEILYEKYSKFLPKADMTPPKKVNKSSQQRTKRRKNHGKSRK